MLNNFGEPSQQFRRNDSFSTVESSDAVADVMRQYVDLSRPVTKQPVIAASSPPNMKFEKSENINVIYNNYYGNSSPEQKPSRNNSFSSFLSGSQKANKILNFVKFLRTKKGAGIVFVLFIVVLSAISSVVSYYVIRANKSIIFDSTTPQETTSPIKITTTDTSTTSYFTTISNPTTTTTISKLTNPTTEEQTTNPTNSTTEGITTKPTTTVSTTFISNISTTPKEITTEDVTTTKPTTTAPNPYPEFFMTRDDWEAEPPRSKNITKLQTPIKRIIIGHTGGRFCSNVTDCIVVVRSIQTQDFSLEDIAYNFLIGVDGKVYEGRGFGYQGQHTKNIGATEYNSIGIMIAFIGNYKSTHPSVDQIILLENFIDFFQQSGNISREYLVFSQDDLMYRDVTADSLNEAVANLKNYQTLYKVHRREEWAALTPKSLSKFSKVMNWNIIGHITNQGCSDLAKCIKEVKKVETDNLNSDNDDIVYNFLVGGKGILFEGRGWDTIGQTDLLPTSAISVIVLGDYRYFAPDPQVEKSLKQLFEDALILGKLANDYKVFGRSDFGQPGPGALLMNQIKKWSRYGNKTTY